MNHFPSIIERPPAIVFNHATRAAATVLTATMQFLHFDVSSSLASCRTGPHGYIPHPNPRRRKFKPSWPAHQNARRRK